jgi:hypothetical protein
VKDSKRFLSQAQAKVSGIAPRKNALKLIAIIIKEPPQAKQMPQIE